MSDVTNAATELRDNMLIAGTNDVANVQHCFDKKIKQNNSYINFVINPFLTHNY